MELEGIEHHTKHYADCDAELSRLLAECRGRMDAIADEYRPRLLAASYEASHAHKTLLSAISDNRGLFESPRTRLFSGIEVGLRKGLSSTEFLRKDGDIIAAIERDYPHLLHTLVKVEKSLKKVPCGELSEAMRSALGIQVRPGVDGIVIARPKDGLNKLVDSMMATFEGAS
jgi:hypothetical protein